MTVDLTTEYLGLQLRTPFVVSSCPLTANLDAALALEHAGAGALVLPSLFEEQIEHDQLQTYAAESQGAESFPEALSYFPELDDYNLGSTGYLRQIEGHRQRLSIPVIASLNGVSPGGWLRYARQLESAGAQALELNAYIVPIEPSMSGEQVENRYVELARGVRESVSIPVALKIGPHFSSLPHLASRLAATGIAGLVLFNRFLEPDIDLEQVRVEPHFTLSRSGDYRLSLRWIAILRSQLTLSLAAGTGVHHASDAIKLIMAGADVVMATAAVMQLGPSFVQSLIDDVHKWLVEHDYHSVRQLRGFLCREHAPDPTAYERGNYLRTLTSYMKDLATADYGRQDAGNNRNRL